MHAGPYIFKRRELATSFETRSRFPELVIQEEKRVRFVVVNGLAIIEKPTSMCIDDAEWYVGTLNLVRLPWFFMLISQWNNYLSALNIYLLFTLQLEDVFLIFILQILFCIRALLKKYWSSSKLTFLYEREKDT